MPMFELTVVLTLEADHQDDAAAQARAIEDALPTLPHVSEWDALALEELKPAPRKG